MNNKSGRGHGAKYRGSLQEPSFSGFVQEIWGGMHPLDKAALATTPIPILGDIVGGVADTRTLWNDPSWTNAGLMGLGMLPFVPSLGTIKAFHGTPHTIDKFSMDKIGTGEGAQAYGHGLYFAENPDVARQYQKQTTSWQLHNADGSLFDPYEKMKNPNVRAILQKTDGDVDAAIKKADELIESIPNTQGAEFAKHDIDVLRGLKLNRPEGKMYQVDIDVEPEDLLDWDALIDEMPAATEAKIRTFPYYDESVERLSEQMPYDNPTYGNLYRYLEEDYEPAELAELMKKSGIKGIQYFDGMSRNAGKGTRNYVIFDDSLIGTPKPFGDY